MNENDYTVYGIYTVSDGVRIVGQVSFVKIRPLAIFCTSLSLSLSLSRYLMTFCPAQVKKKEVSFATVRPLSRKFSRDLICVTNLHIFCNIASAYA